MGQSSDAPKWGAHVDIGGKLGTERSLGEADLLVPLWQDSRTLVFGNLRGRFDNDSDREGNLGLGARRMLEGGWNLGAYGYLDRRRTGNGNYFNQTTLGAEALGRDWDFRANGYLPNGSKVKDLGSTDSAAFSGNSLQVISTTSQERALKGYDAEVGWRAPLFDTEGPRQLRLYAGGYRFKDDVVKVSGPRVRAEFTMAEIPALWSGAQLFLSAEAQDDDARGSQAFVGLRLRVPLGGKERPRTLSAQERRMTAPVVRDVDVVTHTVASTQIETATATAGGQTLVALSSDATTGAALPGAVAAAGANSTVVLSGTFNTTGPTTLQAGQTLMGAGTLTVRTPSGRVVIVTTPAATINSAGAGGGLANPAVLLNAGSNNSTLTGLNISKVSTAGTAGLGVVVDGASGATIENSTITGRETGANSSQGLLIFNSSNIMVRNNHLSATGNGAQNSIAFNLVNSSATVVGNTMAPVGGSDIRYVTLNGGTVLPGSTGNVAGQGICSVNGVNTGSIGFTNVASCP